MSFFKAARSRSIPTCFSCKTRNESALDDVIMGVLSRGREAEGSDYEWDPSSGSCSTWDLALAKGGNEDFCAGKPTAASLSLSVLCG